MEADRVIGKQSQEFLQNDKNLKIWQVEAKHPWDSTHTEDTAHF